MWSSGVTPFAANCGMVHFDDTPPETIAGSVVWRRVMSSGVINFSVLNAAFDERPREPAIGLLAETEFGTRGDIPWLDGYSDYEDWLDSRLGLQMGLSMAGVEATMVEVGLAVVLAGIAGHLSRRMTCCQVGSSQRRRRSSPRPGGGSLQATSRRSCPHQCRTAAPDDQLS